MSSQLAESNGVRIAVEGCGHGVLNGIYDAVNKSCSERGWNGVDLVIICGDFQAVRNAQDLNAMSVPMKYREMADFHEYYSGKRAAPYLTIFIGGNHEASNHLFELYYGGWVAPNIYYMGAANVVRLGGLRIAGLSGIWKGFDFKLPHSSRPPYSGNEIKGLYHVRELDLRKLLQIRTQVDIGLSHDWPRRVEYSGNYEQLFNFKPWFKTDSVNGQLGSAAAEYMLKRLRPPYWFSGHMHCKFTATVQHQDGEGNGEAAAMPSTLTEPVEQASENADEIALDMDDEPASFVADKTAATRNEDEIDLDLDDVRPPAQATTSKISAASSQPSVAPTSQVPDDLRAQLPASFNRQQPARAPASNYREKYPSCAPKPSPPGITNTTTKFLALDKLLPGRSFLELVEIPTLRQLQRPIKLEYDPEWLAITRALKDTLDVTNKSNPHPKVPEDLGQETYLPLIEEEEAWVKENIVAKGLLTIPENFVQVAPVYNPARGKNDQGMPREYPNPQTQSFCDLIGIENKFAITEEEIAERMAAVPPWVVETGHGFYQRGGRGGGRGGRGRGRGGRGMRGGYRITKP